MHLNSWGISIPIASSELPQRMDRFIEKLFDKEARKKNLDKMT
ncbi:hypothetical protein T479_23650 [Lysinibacillus varians]|nr:hypothetical protein T479_23650 [Lysinibacillus varians]